MLVKLAGNIHTRISEQMEILPLTGKNVLFLPGQTYSHTKHNISRSDFKILSAGISEADLLVRENLYISKLNSVLNANIRSPHAPPLLPLITGSQFPRAQKESAQFLYSIE